jgi:hypothetical protein
VQTLLIDGVCDSVGQKKARSLGLTSEPRGRWSVSYNGRLRAACPVGPGAGRWVDWGKGARFGGRPFVSPCVWGSAPQRLPPAVAGFGERPTGRYPRTPPNYPRNRYAAVSNAGRDPTEGKRARSSRHSDDAISCCRRVDLAPEVVGVGVDLLLDQLVVPLSRSCELLLDLRLAEHDHGGATFVEPVAKVLEVAPRDARVRCPVRPPAPTIALPMVEGGKMISTSAPTAAPVQAPCWVGFSVFVTVGRSDGFACVSFVPLIR